MTKKAANKIIDGLADGVAYARIDALWRRTKKPRSAEITTYDWGYRDGLLAARALFGKETGVNVKKNATRKTKRQPEKAA